MENEQFNDIIKSTLGDAKRMLTRKSEGYSTAEDRLHNFRTGAALNGVTMEQVCWGMATKHIISISDMVMSGDTYDSDIWDEKLGDAINYLAILKAITVAHESDSDKVLTDLREKLTGMNDMTVGVELQHASTADTTSYLTPPQTDQQRDIESIKRVADKHNY